jgi:7-carboxy-7-deazaguanine synthase
MDVIEIFESISGEVGITIPQGSPCTFVRFFGCPVGCVYCDTEDSWDKQTFRQFMAPYEILAKVEELGNENVIITGGEPFCQHDLEELLIVLGESEHIESVVVETAGIPAPFDIVNSPSKTTFAVDYKLPSAKSNYPALNTFPYHKLGETDLVKFLIDTQEDLSLALDKCQRIQSQLRNMGVPTFVFSPMDNKNVSETLSALKRRNIEGIINVQIHKILGVA